MTPKKTKPRRTPRTRSAFLYFAVPDIENEMEAYVAKKEEIEKSVRSVFDQPNIPNNVVDTTGKKRGSVPKRAMQYSEFLASLDSGSLKL